MADVARPGAQLVDLDALLVSLDGQDAGFALNRFVTAPKIEEEAVRVLQGIQGKANEEAVEAFGDAAKDDGASTSNKMGVRENSKFEDLVH